MPPKIHDLLRLADKATLPLEKDVEERLKITAVQNNFELAHGAFENYVI